LLALCAIIVAGSYTSCNKMDKKDNAAAESVQLKAISAKVGFTDYPAVEDGMLKFRDDDHYDAYLQFLDRAVSLYAADSTDTVNDEHTVLQNIEGGLGFKSVRSISHNKFMEMNEVGWTTLEEIPEEHFINSADLRSTLSTTLDVKIGNDIIHYINRNFAVRVNENESGLIRQYHDLDENTTIDDLIRIDIGQRFTTIYELTGDGRIWERELHPLGEWNIFRFERTFPEPCNNPNLLKIRGIALKWNYEPGLEADFIVNYGDGTQEAKHSVYISDGYEVAPFTHQYPGPGSYILTVTAYYNGQIAAQRTEEVIVSGNCAIKEKNSWWHYAVASNDASRAVSGRIYIEFYTSRKNKMRMIAETRSMQKKDDKWSLAKGRIEVYAECSAKDISCNEVDHLEAYQLKTNSKEFLKHRSRDSRFYWTTASSKHYITVNGVQTILPITITSCP